MKKKYITITIISTIIIASTIGFCFLKKNINDKTVNKSEYYKIASVEKVFINGVLTPRESESIYIDSTKGEISEVHVTDGQAVNAGDSLFTYNNPTIEAQIEEISEQITSNENSKVSINNKLTNAKNNLAEKENQLNKLKKQLEELKCFRSNLRPKEKQIKDSDIESIKELRTQGLSYREISQQTSWSKATVCRVLNGVYD